MVSGPATPRADGKSESLAEVPSIGEVLHKGLMEVMADSQGLEPIANLPTSARKPDARPSGEVRLRTEIL